MEFCRNLHLSGVVNQAVPRKVDAVDKAAQDTFDGVPDQAHGADKNNRCHRRGRNESSQNDSEEQRSNNYVRACFKRSDIEIHGSPRSDVAWFDAASLRR